MAAFRWGDPASSYIWLSIFRGPFIKEFPYHWPSSLPYCRFLVFFFFFLWEGGGKGGSWGTRDSSINNIFTMNFLMGEVPLFLFVFKFFDFVFCGVSQSRHYILFDIYISELWQDFNGFCPSSG